MFPSHDQGGSDLESWYDTSNGNGYYITTSAGANGDVMRWNGTSTLDETWWTSTLGQSALSSTTAWRPLLVYERNLFIGDAYQLHRIDPALTVSNGIVQFEANERISALGVDQGSGRMLVATSAGSNYSATLDKPTKIYIYDGFSNKPSRVVPVSGLVTAFKSVGNTTYVFYGNKLGRIVTGKPS